MPVRNEAGRFLSDVVEHIRGFAGEKLFVYDDRSTDGTFDLLRDLGVTAVQRPENVPGFVDNEGAFRQWGWDAFVAAMNPEPRTWILAQDADELLYGVPELPDLLRREAFDILGVTFFHMWNETHYRVDKAWKPTVSSRLFRFYPGGEFSQRRLACGSEPTYVQQLIRTGSALWTTGLAMKHLGYLRDEDKAAKYHRYMTLDKGDFHSRTHLESILDNDPVLKPWTLPA